MVATCPQQVVRVVLMEFGERQMDKREALYGSNKSDQQAERGSSPTRATSS